MIDSEQTFAKITIDSIVLAKLLSKKKIFRSDFYENVITEKDR